MVLTSRNWFAMQGPGSTKFSQVNVKNNFTSHINNNFFLTFLSTRSWYLNINFLRYRIRRSSRNWFAMQGPVAIIMNSWKVIFIWETVYWTRAIKRFVLFDILKSLYSEFGKFMILKLKSSRLSYILVLSWPLSSNSRHTSKNDADEASSVVSLTVDKNVKTNLLSMCDVKLFLTFTWLNLVLLWQLFYLCCSSIVIHTAIVTAGTFEP
jgi:hypothetical protein